MLVFKELPPGKKRVDRGNPRRGTTLYDCYIGREAKAHVGTEKSPQENWGEQVKAGGGKRPADFGYPGMPTSRFWGKADG